MIINKLQCRGWLVVFTNCFLLLNIFISCSSQEKHFVNLTNRVDPDIVLVNIGNANRTTIGEVLLMINRCQPSVIAFDGWFLDKKSSSQDSVLMVALDSIQNDVLAYYIDSTNTIVKSDAKFSSLVNQEGLVAVEEIQGLASAIKPIQTINNEEHMLFALKIIQQWKAEFSTVFKTNQIIPIKYTRTLDHFFQFDYTELDDIDCAAFRNKIVLVGYLGPENEDKHFTPLRLVKKYEPDTPDTYGLVIIANEIRTILEYEKK